MAAESIRFTPGPTFDLKMVQRLLSTRMQQGAGLVSGAIAIANGTTAGKLKTVATGIVMANGLQISKAATDDLWDLSAETDTIAGQFRAYWLLLSSAGAASIAAGSNASSAAAARLALPDLDFTKGVAGVYVAGASTDFNHAGGLSAQGTIHNGIPAGANIGMGAYGLGFLTPDWTTIRKP